MNGKLWYIPVEQIQNHPNNPRKELGDLTELTESIRANGVLQNLTVVPVGQDAYYAVIGNRRLAAAKLAGLSVVPCMIATDMSEKEQMSTMLLENMQRSDLTVYEQAQGFQTMLDLGDSVEEIAQKSGFSQSTIRHRVKMLALDQKKFKESEARGGTLQDYIALEKIEDPDLKNEVLDKIGTKDFQNALKTAMSKEKEQKTHSQRLRTVSTFATELLSRDEIQKKNLIYLQGYQDYDTKREVEIPEDKDQLAYYFLEGRYGIDLYREKSQQDNLADAERAQKAAAAEALRSRCEQVQNRAFESRKSFVQEMSARDAKKYLPQIARCNAQTMFQSQYYGSLYQKELFCNMLGIPCKSGEYEVQDLEDAIEHFGPEHVMLCAAYSKLDSVSNSYMTWTYSLDFRRYGVFQKECKDLDQLYALLCEMGYELTEEEEQMRDGSHPLLLSDDKEPEVA